MHASEYKKSLFFWIHWHYRDCSALLSSYLPSNVGLLMLEKVSNDDLKSQNPKTSSLACTGISLCLRQLLGRGEHIHNALCYCECVLSTHCELLNHLLTTAWSELRQWSVNTLQWMKGLGIKWQDVLKEEQVVVEEGPARLWRSAPPCISLWLFLHFLHLHAPSLLLSIFHTCLR